MLEYTGVDGIMIGRATLGSPWILEQIITYLRDGTIIPEPTNEEKLKKILKHIELEVEEKAKKLE